MPKIKVYFSDGYAVEFHEDQTFQTIVRNETGSSLSQVFTLWSHHHDGLLPSFLEMTMYGLYFFDVENPTQIFNSSAVTRIEIL